MKLDDIKICPKCKGELIMDFNMKCQECGLSLIEIDRIYNILGINRKKRK